jgi:hypothetical protein
MPPQKGGRNRQKKWNHKESSRAQAQMRKLKQRIENNIDAGIRGAWDEIQKPFELKDGNNLNKGNKEWEKHMKKQTSIIKQIDKATGAFCGTAAKKEEVSKWLQEKHGNRSGAPVKTASKKAAKKAGKQTDKSTVVERKRKREDQEEEDGDEGEVVEGEEADGEDGRTTSPVPALYKSASRRGKKKWSPKAAKTSTSAATSASDLAPPGKMSADSLEKSDLGTSVPPGPPKYFDNNGQEFPVDPSLASLTYLPPDQMQQLPYSIPYYSQETRET